VADERVTLRVDVIISTVIKRVKKQYSIQ